MSYGRLRPKGMLCPSCLQQLPLPPIPKRLRDRLPARFWARVRYSEEPGCWIWRGAGTNGKRVWGYGTYFHEGRYRKAHRIAYLELRGFVNEKMDLDHLCRIRACVNPWHLEPVTRRENILRGRGLPSINAKKIQCKHGHPYDSVNTYVHPNGRWRFCRACHRQWDSVRRPPREKKS